VRDAFFVQVGGPGRDVIPTAGREADRVVAVDGLRGVRRPAQLQQHVTAGHRHDHRVPLAAFVEVAEPRLVLGSEDPGVPGQAGVQVGNGELDVVEALGWPAPA
jgi:hypothetical protein